jgi:hypothetical protein
MTLLPVDFSKDELAGASFGFVESSRFCERFDDGLGLSKSTRALKQLGSQDVQR